MKMKKQTIKIGYKVLCPKYGRLYSYLGPDFARNGSGIIYRIKKWVQPQKGCGPLALFRRREDAERFMYSSDVIYKCWYVPSKQKMQWNRIDQFTHCEVEGKVLADSVYLIEKVCSWYD